MILIDCPPRADGVLCANAVRAADTAVLVVETGAFALQGAVRARGIFEELARELGRTLDVRILATMFEPRTRFSRDLLVAMQARFEGDMFDTAIRRNIRLREAAAFGLPVQELDPGCPAAADFEALGRELLEFDARPSVEETQDGEALIPAGAPAFGDAPRTAIAPPDPGPHASRLDPFSDASAFGAHVADADASTGAADEESTEETIEDSTPLVPEATEPLDPFDID